MEIKDTILGLHRMGLKQKHICKLTGIEPYTISRWSSGGAPPAAQYTMQLVDLYSKATSGPRAVKALLAKADAS
jgi:hypothetical protein